MRVRNRIAMPPMCMYSAQDGRAGDFHATHYGARAIGGVGLIIVEATGVTANGRISDNCLGIYDDGFVEGLGRIAAAIKAYGAAAAIQLGHAGRKCLAAVPQIVAPSAIAFDTNHKTPAEMSRADIEELLESYRTAARRAGEAGFDMVEIHAAHGYLLSTFLSPLSNRRGDEYGGSAENRARLPGRVVDAVRQSFGGSVGIRISAEDYIPEGNRPEDLAEMVNMFKAKGVDVVNVSSGGVAPAALPVFPGYQVRFAEAVRERTGLPVMAGGLLTSPRHCEEVVANNRADMVYVGREILRNPHFPLQAAHELGADFPWPKQYVRASYK
ncbi:MAG: NADH:flavin oxidoreductase/NADH oxidase [Defluviitaleaceae bacterium]|nr:NADH:flavin oxidoreductase/NADH oxidase [Defluviitaleaceae bacterium]